jgi:hypothetical protein
LKDICEGKKKVYLDISRNNLNGIEVGNILDLFEEKY